MKKIIALILCLLLFAVCFSGCEFYEHYVFTRKEYKDLYTFYKRFEPGMTKQEIYDELGYPDTVYYDEAPLSYNIRSDEDKEKFDERLEAGTDVSIRWSYHCYKLSMAETYSLMIKFDADDKATEVSFKLQYGA